LVIATGLESAVQGPEWTGACGVGRYVGFTINVDTGIQRALDCDVLKPIHRPKKMIVIHNRSDSGRLLSIFLGFATHFLPAAFPS